MLIAITDELMPWAYAKSVAPNVRVGSQPR